MWPAALDTEPEKTGGAAPPRMPSAAAAAASKDWTRSYHDSKTLVSGARPQKGRRVAQGGRDAECASRRSLTLERLQPEERLEPGVGGRRRQAPRLGEAPPQSNIVTPA